MEKQYLKAVPFDKIQIPKMRRKPNPEKESELMASIEESGLYYPIILGPGDESGHYRLIAGMNRINAFFKLGRIAIPAYYYPTMSDAQMRLVEIDENLQRAELTQAEIKVAIAERKIAYEELHPETAFGTFTPADEIDPEVPKPKSFLKDAAEKTGRSERAVYRDAQIGKNLNPEAVNILSSIPETIKIANRQIDLEQLSKMPAHEQKAVAEYAVANKISSLPVAVREMDAPSKPEGKIPKTVLNPSPKAKAKFIDILDEIQEKMRLLDEKILPTALEDEVYWSNGMTESLEKKIAIVAESLLSIKKQLRQ
jgi:hypothetical protein